MVKKKNLFISTHNKCIKNLIDDLELENNLNNTVQPKDKHPTGRVVGIIRKKWRQYCGIIQHSVVENVS
jgi:hypothetical protein